MLMFMLRRRFTLTILILMFMLMLMLMSQCEPAFKRPDKKCLRKHASFSNQDEQTQSHVTIISDENDIKIL